MAMNEKLPVIEPVQGDRKNGVATFCRVIAIVVWCLGGVMTAFSVLAYLDIGTFQDLFAEIFPDGIYLYTILSLGLGVFFTGLMLMAVSEVLYLLARNGSMLYQIRSLDQVIPQTISVDSPFPVTPEERKEAWAGSYQDEPDMNPGNQYMTMGAGERSSVQITININGAAGEVKTETKPAREEKGSGQTAAAKEQSSKLFSSEPKISLLDDDLTETMSPLGSLLTK